MTETKMCRTCGVEKTLDEFHPHNTTRDGRRTSCRTCHNSERRHYDPLAALVNGGRQRVATFDVDPEEWMDQAACLYRGKDVAEAKASVDRFFLQKTNPRRMSKEVAAAKAVCDTCPVTAECLAYAEKTHNFFGIWGGLTPNERVKRRRQANRQQRGSAA